MRKANSKNFLNQKMPFKNYPQYSLYQICFKFTLYVFIISVEILLMQYDTPVVN